MRRVYFIKPIGMAGPVKIGCSSSPDNRRRSLATWSPFPLEIVAEIEGDIKLEQRFHTRFLGSYKSHEWFDWSPELQAVIDAVAAGTFDIATLPKPQQLPRKRKGTAYSTPGWRYHRSVHARVLHLEKRGLPWAEVCRAEIWGFNVKTATPEEIAAAKVHIEPFIAAWTERFPPASRYRRAQPQAAAA